MFFVGHVPKPVAAKWILASDVIVCLFTGPRVVWKDAVQNKFFDALAAGKPTASNFEGFQSIVARDADIGVIMDPASPSRGALQLASLLSDAAWRDGVAVRSAVLARNEFDRERLAGELAEVLAEAKEPIDKRIAKRLRVA
jgi:glycosyltransferase involved in cell wall biosynthesis